MPRRKKDLDDNIMYYDAVSVTSGDTIIIPRQRILPPIKIPSKNFVSGRVLPVFADGFTTYQQPEELERVTPHIRSLSVNSTTVNETRCCSDDHVQHGCCPRQFKSRSKVQAFKRPPSVQLSGVVQTIGIGILDLHSYLYGNEIINKLYPVYKHVKLTSYITYTYYVEGKRKTFTVTQDSHQYIYEGFSSIKRSRYYFATILGERSLVHHENAEEHIEFENHTISFNSGFAGSQASVTQNENEVYAKLPNFRDPLQPVSQNDPLYATTDYASSFVNAVSGDFQVEIKKAIERTKPTYGHNIRMGDNGLYYDNPGSSSTRPAISGVEVSGESGQYHHSSRWVDLPTANFEGNKYIIKTGDDGYTDLYDITNGSKYATVPSDEIGVPVVRTFDSTLEWVNGILQ